MWGKIIVVILIWAFICAYWEGKVEENRAGKRKYKLLQGMTFLVTAGISFILYQLFGLAVLLYTAVGIAAGIGSILAAINPNLREIYIQVLFCAIVMLIIAPHFFKHVIIFSLIYIGAIGSTIDKIKLSIQYMRDGIDPDVIEEEKAARRRFGFKIAKLIFRIWS